MSAAPRAGMHAAVLGSPISHSLSPVLHRAAYAELGLDWTYEAIAVGEGGLAEFVGGLDRSWAGLSLTMPLKREALELARMKSETVVATRSANTLLPLGSGWAAENTDVPGLVAALEAASVEPAQRATIIGGGATAASAVVALARHGATSIHVVVRRVEALEPLRHLAAAVGIELVGVPWESAVSVLDRPIVVSTVPKGAADALGAVVPDGPGALFDVLYDPWPTALAHAWAARGGTVIGGLDLLVHQAVLQVELMTGRRPTVGLVHAAGTAALAAR